MAALSNRSLAPLSSSPVIEQVSVIIQADIDSSLRCTVLKEKRMRRRIAIPKAHNRPITQKAN
ncbi:hypothetical protein CDL12_19959 [Handroanthus impetiginosus]|uniref:Uncharacterized protein n=1 Tax=Handroanthus impetiginosus TaxID=429701 RepID=A0A2G9GQH7_9LAMI|nr:hypothetical protein CDL12_19959 [Handroanthus impetiginosus]